MTAAPQGLVGYAPDHVLPPGETLRETLEQIGMTQAELSRRVGLSTKTVNLIVKGLAPITPDTALALERVLNVPAYIWNALEAHYQEHVARARETEQLQDEQEWLNAMPVAELIKRGFVSEVTEPAERIRQICRFFGVATPSAWREVWGRPAAAFRRSDKFSVEAGATAAWLRIGELEAQEIRTRQYDRDRFETALATARKLTRADFPDFLPHLVSAFADSGVAFVVVPEITGCRASGVARWLAKDKALIQLSLRYRWEDQFWFSLFHEAAHLLLHPRSEMFVHTDEPGVAAPSYSIEEEADRFAADFLVPPSVADTLPSYKTAAAIRDLAEDLELPPAILVGRLQREGVIPYSRHNSLRRRFTPEQLREAVRPS
jgi:HTH-type transcriptional regulator/antitoxin HigA